MTLEILPGAHAWSHDGGRVGVLCLHGFTGNPASMRPVAEAFADAGYSVELPRLPGHGTTVEDMMTTGFPDWAAEAETALARLRTRTERVIVAGQSMGGLLALWVGVHHPDIAGLVLVNPVTMPLDPEIVEMARGMLEEGTDLIPGGGSDIADPEVVDSAYPGTPLAPLISMIEHGSGPLTDRFGELTMPMLLINSVQDHVVDPANSDHLETTAGGPVERVRLERSYHVATIDYDRDLIISRALEFAARVAGS